MKHSKLLFSISGSIASYKAADTISKLVQKGYEIQVVATKSALKFIGSATLEGLTGKKVMTDIFKNGKMMSHIDLVKWADIMILAPATASTINSMRSGLGDNLVLSLFLAHDWGKPYIIAPAMNTKMWMHPATQSSLRKLIEWGVNVLEPNTGDLACGDYGPGRMVEPVQIIHSLENNVKMKNKISVLVTSGGTKEPIDGVRYISNISTGNTASSIANYFISSGHNLTYLASDDAKVPKGKFKKVIFNSYYDLEEKLFSSVVEQKFDILIHAAAVSDYIPKNIDKSIKIDSQKQNISIDFKKTPKMVNSIKAKSKNKNIKLVAFKLTADQDEEKRIKKIKKLFQQSNADLIVQNDISKRIGNVQTGYNIYNLKSKVFSTSNSKELGEKILNEIKSVL